VYGLRIRIREGEKVVRRKVPTILRALTPLALGKSVRRTVYATVQPPKLPPPKPSVSMGVEGSSSGSGALDVMVKSDTKKSIVVYVVRGLNCENV
jgi:hypothetical protein